MRKPMQRNHCMGLTIHQDRRVREVLITMFKEIQIRKTDLFEIYSKPKRKGNCKTIKMEYSRTEIKKNARSRGAVNVWNQLPSHVIDTDNVNEFKTNLDVHMKWI